MYRLSFIAAATALALSSLPAHAQQFTQGELRAGMRVRVSAPQLERETATLLAYHGDTLLLLAGSNDTLPLALASVEEMEVSVGTRLDRRGGAIAGFGIGGLLGAGIGAVAALADRDAGFPTGATISGMAGGAVLGLLSGAIMGSGRIDDWRPVGPGKRNVAAKVAPHVDRSGVGIAVSMPLRRW